MALCLNPESLKTISSKYEEFKLLNKGEEKAKIKELGWDSNPIKSKADEIIKETDALLHTVEKSNKYYPRVLALRCTILYEASKILNENGQDDLSLKLLEEAYSLLSEYSGDEYIVYLYFRITNHLSYHLQKNGKLNEAKKILENACNLYNSLNIDECYDTDELFKNEVEIKGASNISIKFEKLVTNNFQILTNIYNLLGDHDNFGKFLHTVLRRQLEMNDGDSMIWIQKVMQISKFFIDSQLFREARHHLAASHHVIQSSLKKMKDEENPQESEFNEEALKGLSASVAALWVKYGLTLFGVSKRRMAERYLSEENPIMARLWGSTYEQKSIEQPSAKMGVPTLGDEDVGTEAGDKGDGRGREDSPEAKPEAEKENQINSNTDKVEETKSLEGEETGEAPTLEPETGKGDEMTFPSLDLSYIETEVTADVVETVDQARGLFVHTLNWLKEAKSYYSFAGHPHEYLACMMDLSELYRSIAFYETDWDEQYKIHRNRQEVLETLCCILKEVDSEGSSIDVHVELLRELSEVHIELLTLNLHQMSVINGKVEIEAHKAEAFEDVQARLEGLGEVFIPEPNETTTISEDYNEVVKAFQD